MILVMFKKFWENIKKYERDKISELLLKNVNFFQNKNLVFIWTNDELELKFWYLSIRYWGESHDDTKKKFEKRKRNDFLLKK